MTNNKKYKFIYKIINLINKKEYIGKHETNNINDNYFGSGLILKKAIKKYGKENFEKIIIEYCDTIEELNLREIYWIKTLNTFSPIGYNINTGGSGGDNFTNNPNKEEIRKKIIKNRPKRIYTDEEKEKCRQRMLGKKLKPHKKHSCIHCGKKVSKANLNRWHNEYCKLNPNRIIKTVKKRVYKNIKKEVKLCEHCNKTITINNYNIYHGNNCKYNPYNLENPEIYKLTNSYKYRKNISNKISGNKQTEESNKKRSEKLKGRKTSKKHKEKMSNLYKEKWKNIKENNIIHTCKYCNKTSYSLGNMNRWHNDNCKHKN